MAKNKIFLLICVSFIVGIGIASFLPFVLLNKIYLWLLAILVLTIFLFLGNIFKLKLKYRITILGLVFVLLGIVRFYFTIPVYSKDKIYYFNKNNVDVTGIISNYVQRKRDGQKIILNIYFNNKDKSKLSGKLLLFADQFPQYKYGDILRVQCRLQKPVSFNDFDYASYLAIHDIYSVCNSSQIKIIRSDGILTNSILLKIFSFKRKIVDLVDSGLNNPQAGILKAMLLGDKMDISTTIRNLFAMVGLSHVIAISGMHIAILMTIVFLCFNKLGFSRKYSFYFSSILLVFYIILIGMPASAVRAGIMNFLVLLAFNMGRLSNVNNALILTGALILLFNPLYLIYSISFQLSFLAVLGIIYFFPILDKKIFQKIYQNNRHRKIICDILNVSISAQIFTLPLIATKFSIISFIAPLSNLLILWSLPFILVGGFLAIIFSLFFPGLSFIFFAPTNFLISYILLVAKILSMVPFAFLKVF